MGTIDLAVWTVRERGKGTHLSIEYRPDIVTFVLRMKVAFVVNLAVRTFQTTPTRTTERVDTCAGRRFRPLIEKIVGTVL